MRDEFRNRMRDRKEQWESRWENRSKHSHIWTGAFILIIGVAALLRTTVADFPTWIFTWPTFLLALGVFIGLKHNFRGFAWLVLILVGGAFLLRDFYPQLSLGKFIWPGVLILIGAMIMFRPKRRCGPSQGAEKKNAGSPNSTTILDEEESWSQDDVIDSTAIFGGSKKNMLSKDFKGGDIVNIFGGTELNLSQADIKGRVELEITTIFGGTKLIVPSNWEVKSEAVTIFGGLEDKRSLQPDTQSPEKVLVLRGTVLFGGIEVKSF